MVNESNDWVSVWTHLIALYLKYKGAKWKEKALGLILEMMSLSKSR